MTFDRLRTTLFFVAAAAAACLMPAQSDTWWQLRTGQEIWRTRHVVLADSFSHTVAGGYWPNHEWLSQAIFFAAYRAGGMPAVTALAAAAVVAAWAIVWRLTPGDRGRRLLIAAFGVVGSAMAWSIRPQVLTLLLLALTMLALVRRRYAWLPVIFVVWANLHGGVTLGMILLAAAIVAETIDERRLPARLAAWTAASFAATALTPLGVTLWTEVVASLGRLREYRVFEWRPPSIADPAALPFWLLAAALSVLFVLAPPWRRRSPLNVVVWGALALLPIAVTSGRTIPPFTLLAVPAIASLAESRFPSRAACARVERPAFNAAIAGLMCAVVVLMIGRAWTLPLARLGWRPLPDRAIAALRACPPALYNRYDEGGFLIWFVPEKKVFVDSRQDPYPPSLIEEQIRVESTGNYEELFDRYAIRCAFVPSDSRVASRLAAGGWTRLYDDDGWSVLTRQ